MMIVAEEYWYIFQKCQFVTLGTQCEMCMCHIVIYGLSGSSIFFRISYMAQYLKKVIKHKMCVLTFSTTSVWNIFQS